MLRLTMIGQPGRDEMQLFVNPRRVAHIYPRTVRERVTEDPAPPNTKIEYRSRVEGCFVSFGGAGDDGDTPVRESAEEVAREVADAIEMWGIADVAQRTRDIADREAADTARRGAAGCKLPATCECPDCIPF